MPSGQLLRRTLQQNPDHFECRRVGRHRFRASVPIGAAFAAGPGETDDLDDLL